MGSRPGMTAIDADMVRLSGRVLFVTLDEIDWIEAADNYVCLHCGAGTHMVRETMNELDARLDPARFARVHRSTIVNIDRIKLGNYSPGSRATTA